MCFWRIGAYLSYGGLVGQLVCGALGLIPNTVLHWGYLFNTIPINPN